MGQDSDRGRHYWRRETTIRQRQRVTVIMDKVELSSPRAEMRDVQALPGLSIEGRSARPTPPGIRQPVLLLSLNPHWQTRSHPLPAVSVQRRGAHPPSRGPSYRGGILGDRSQQGKTHTISSVSNHSCALNRSRMKFYQHFSSPLQPTHMPM